jgi:Spy/CpxP family protein refolding chaperone
MVQRLGLNEDQSRKVDALMRTTREKHRQIQQQSDEQLKGVLTPEQWQRFQELRPPAPHDRAQGTNELSPTPPRLPPGGARNEAR